MSPETPPPLLEARIESFRFGGCGREILRGVHLAVAPGSLTAVLGASGSGKSTLARVLGGMLPAPPPQGVPYGRDGARAAAGAQGRGGEDPDDDVLEAEIALAGERLVFAADRRVRIDQAGWARHVGVLPQEAGHFLSGARETVAEELAFALENQGVARPLLRERVHAAAVALGLEDLLERDVERLSGGQERIVALAALAIVDPDVLVLDEPFAGLDAGARRRVAEWIGRRCSAGRAVVHLSRRRDALTARAHGVWELDGGALVLAAPEDGPARPPTERTAPPAATTAVQPVPPVQRVPAVQPAPPVQPAASPPSSGGPLPTPLLELAGAGIGYRFRESPRGPLRRRRWGTDPVVTGVDLSLRPGETVALLGPNGAGKTTLLKTAAGLLEPLSGAVRRSGRVGLLLQRSGDQLFERTVRREVGFGVDDPRAVSRILAELGLADAAGTHPYELPGAARRLVALATVLVREPDVLLCDEPTVALDDAALDLLRRVLARRTERGRAVLFSTHDEAFAAAAAERVVRLPAPRTEPRTEGTQGTDAKEAGRRRTGP